MEEVVEFCYVGVIVLLVVLCELEGDFLFYVMIKYVMFVVVEVFRGEFVKDGIGIMILCFGFLNMDIWDVV